MATALAKRKLAKQLQYWLRAVDAGSLGQNARRGFIWNGQNALK